MKLDFYIYFINAFIFGIILLLLIEKSKLVSLLEGFYVF